ncbi:MAG TPA: polysaccharide deacetylase family protein [Armatimonadota bacterium]|jgi:peptidoglycan/xylan/chitin deacetylase (PgdA/CDA1 family)
MKSKYWIASPCRLALWVLALGLAGGLAGSGARAAEEPLTVGVGLLSTGQLAAATAAFTQALAVRPRCAEAHAGYGAALLRQGQTDTALVEFEAALEIDPTLTAAHLGRAAALLDRGRSQEAASEYASVAAAGGPEAPAAAAGEAWVLCLQGNYEQARALLETAASADSALGAYVRSAADFALRPDSAPSPLGTVSNPASWVGLGSCLTSPGAAWMAQSPLGVIALPALAAAEEHPPVVPLRMAAPAPGAGLRGSVSLVLAPRAPAGSAYLVATIGSRFAGLSQGPSFAQPLDATTWPTGDQQLQVQAFDARGRLLARGAVAVNVLAANLTLAETATPPASWARRELARLLTPGVLPGVAAQLRGEIAWRQDRLVEAQSNLTEAFRADPYLPRARAELLTVSRSLGLPVLENAPRVSHGPTAQRWVALTFDDGPHPKLTPWILDQLERVGAHATFFLVGKQVEMYPDLAREIVARGHEIASHTYTHQDLTSLTELEVERELAASRSVMAATTGVQAVYFRPPGGNYDGAVARAAGRWGFTPIFWSCNICDYYQNVQTHVVTGMMRKIEPGGIILLHNGEDLTVKVLPDLLRALQADGYRMVSVGELLGTRSQPGPGRTYPTQ